MVEGIVFGLCILVHCLEGKRRTGAFTVLVLSMLFPGSSQAWGRAASRGPKCFVTAQSTLIPTGVQQKPDRSKSVGVLMDTRPNGIKPCLCDLQSLIFGALCDLRRLGKLLWLGTSKNTPIARMVTSRIG